MLQGTTPGDARPSGFTPWQMVARDHVNPLGGERLYRIGLVPPDSAVPAWRAGDIAEFEMPDGQRRSYSIASLPSEGRLDLLVRETKTTDGRLGAGTAWLLHQNQPGQTISLRIKPNDAFRAPAGDGPLLLVGAGSGLAGLRPHILEALGAKQPAWLIYGERHGDSHGHSCRELQAWHRDGSLYRFNLALSCPEGGQGRYVQDIVTQYAGDLKHFMAPGGRVAMCGGRAMGAAVDAALTQALGEDWMTTAIAESRYRRALF